ncbi:MULTISPECIES: hypothetical protein [Bordetella]|uniref:Uncharacterized protein n=1 Tax=Bordetella pseudohinzii TaxID=1331258 RepID=A0A0J6C4Q2_9BORD|nr:MULTISPECIES: hypothetical protein [Bordetella]ANY15781.1 hypothetical protein BBN53_07610 [Bordetella pseudohinzii]KMM24247.1 hypothetical protein L540_07440 [Bordetella pseudohinzii]KXA78723.1 hypothetical protein AW877_10845 [Bordetella pseudohinzii]KXA81349.1 hypothetical protein AW878_04815 [Bordetella pseudohinzii]QII85849.1 hypothetical protein G3T20_14915 [Bordetella hinzii]
MRGAHSGRQIIAESQEARKIATLWAYLHDVPVIPCIQLAELWFQATQPVAQRTWSGLETHLRTKIKD